MNDNRKRGTPTRTNTTSFNESSKGIPNIRTLEPLGISPTQVSREKFLKKLQFYPVNDAYYNALRRIFSVRL